MSDDRRRAEALLHELAIELRRLPINERTRALNVRALAAKRAVEAWGDAPVDDAQSRERTIQGIVALQDEVLALSLVRGSCWSSDPTGMGGQPLHARSARPPRSPRSWVAGVTDSSASAAS